MAVTFLRGDAVSLGPVEDEPDVDAMPWALARAARPRVGDGPDRVIGLAVLDAGSAHVGLVALEDVDWVAREARVTHRGAHAREALALAARYAFGELGLARLVAEPADRAAEATLRDAGFRPTSGGPWELAGGTALLPGWPA